MIELLAPAGDLEKLKVALLYGADACFIGGKKFSLRARGSNFGIEEIKEACDFAHALNKKVYVTMNILPHNNDLEGLDEYILELEKCGVDACIVASKYIASRIKAISSIEVHLSTQASVTNSLSVKHYQSLGFERVVLAREVSLEELKKIRKNTDCELEVFIHGGMCVSYSGRCILSNNMTDRDSNRGGCAHSCRWNYRLYHNDERIGEDYFAMSSKDLSSVEFIPSLIDLGVNSLKIEGRMKSVHYIAQVVRTYRALIDDYLAGELKDMAYYAKEIKRAENRETSIGFYNGEPTINEQLYNSRSEEPTQSFCGFVLDYQDGYAIIEERNKFMLGDEIEVFGPNKLYFTFKVSEILNQNNESLEFANQPKEILKVKVPEPVTKYSMMRILNK